MPNKYSQKYTACIGKVVCSCRLTFGSFCFPLSQGTGLHVLNNVYDASNAPGYMLLSLF